MMKKGGNRASDQFNNPVKGVNVLNGDHSTLSADFRQQLNAINNVFTHQGAASRMQFLREVMTNPMVTATDLYHDKTQPHILAAAFFIPDIRSPKDLQINTPGSTYGLSNVDGKPVILAIEDKVHALVANRSITNFNNNFRKEDLLESIGDYSASIQRTFDLMEGNTALTMPIHNRYGDAVDLETAQETLGMTIYGPEEWNRINRLSKPKPPGR